MNIYSEKAEARRKQFNRLINSCNMVLMNNIPEIDSSVWENWQGDSPMNSEECEWFVNDATTPSWCCNTHRYDGTGDYAATDEHPGNCDFEDSDYAEVYQWFAVGDSDADFLKRHGQYITYSDMLDTYFLAITHFGTSWDYTSMVNDFEDCYVGLEGLDEDKEVV